MGATKRWRSSSILSSARSAGSPADSKAMVPSESSDRIGLIAGSGQLPGLFAAAAKKRGLFVVAVAHLGETDPSLESAVDSISWVRLGQVGRMAQVLREAGVTKAVMAGGIHRSRALTEVRPDLGALRVAMRIRRFGD